MPLGFSAGKYFDEPTFLKRLDFFLTIGCNALEVHPNMSNEKGFCISSKVAEKIRLFEYISLHSPTDLCSFNYTETSKQMCSTISDWVKNLGVKQVVVHPDTITDSECLHKTGWTLAIENMGVTKADGRNVKQMKKWLDIFPAANMVLDLHHVFANDRTMKLAHSFWNSFSDRITQIHISGFESKREMHQPLHLLPECNEIVNFARGKNVPTIIEVNTWEWDFAVLEKEFNFLKTNL